MVKTVFWAAALKCVHSSYYLLVQDGHGRWVAATSRYRNSNDSWIELEVYNRHYMSLPNKPSRAIKRMAKHGKAWKTMEHDGEGWNQCSLVMFDSGAEEEAE